MRFVSSGLLLRRERNAEKKYKSGPSVLYCYGSYNSFLPFASSAAANREIQINFLLSSLALDSCKAFYFHVLLLQPVEPS